MTENATETRTVQQYRHEARRVLKQSREALAVRTDATRQVYTLLNGTIESIIAGRPGYTQDEQVERLTNARSVVAENREKIAEAVAAAKAEVQAIIDAWDETFDAALVKADEVLAEAATFARERDFDAWQAEKQRRRGGYGYSEPDESDEDDEDDEDSDSDF